MGPGRGPAPQDSSGAKLNQDSLKYDMILCVLNPSVSPEREKNSSEFPRNAHEEAACGTGLKQSTGDSTENKGHKITECEIVGMALKDHPVPTAAPAVGRDTFH